MNSPRAQRQVDDGGEDENYFVSLSDLMTGMLFIFIILTTALALHYHLKTGELAKAVEKATEKEQDAAKLQLRANDLEGKAKALEGLHKIALQEAGSALAKANSALAEATQAKGAALQVREALDALAKLLREREQMRRKVLQKLVDQLRARKLNVTLDETNGILRLPERLLFKTGEAKVEPEGRDALQILAELMTPVVREGCELGPLKWEAVYIEGHTDSVSINTGQFPSNWELSTARAISTYNTLSQADPALGKFVNHEGKAVLGTSGYADQRPVADNNSEDGRRQNRRIDIRFVMAYPSRAEIDEMERRLKQIEETTK